MIQQSRSPWTARRSNQSILKGIFMEGLMLKLKLQYFGHLMRRADSLEKTLMLGKIEGRRRRGWQRMRWLDGFTKSMDMSLCKLRVRVEEGKPGMLQFMGSQRVGHDLVTEEQWTVAKQKRLPTAGNCPSYPGQHVCSITKLCLTLLWLYGLQPSRVLCPWDCPSKNTRVGSHFLLHGFFPNQNVSCSSYIGRQILYHGAIWEAHIQDWQRSKSRSSMFGPATS